MNLADAKPDQNVIYVPNHANGDVNHKDVERGVVAKVTEFFVFVKFPNSPDAKACNPWNLVEDK